MFSCEFCDISKNIFSYKTPPVGAFFENKNHKKMEMNITVIKSQYQVKDIGEYHHD